MSTLRFEPIHEAAHQWVEEVGEWPWQLIGVMPTQDDAAQPDFLLSRHNAFIYTVGLEPCVWMPMTSIEGRFLGPNLSAWIMNTLAFATRDAVIRPRDEVLIGLGIQGEEDQDGVLWIGDIEPNDFWRQTFQSDAPTVMPVLWSSPLGWRDD